MGYSNRKRYMSKLLEQTEKNPNTHKGLVFSFWFHLLLSCANSYKCALDRVYPDSYSCFGGLNEGLRQHR